jgi:hypothetical protein
VAALVPGGDGRSSAAARTKDRIASRVFVPESFLHMLWPYLLFSGL